MRYSGKSYKNKVSRYAYFIKRRLELLGDKPEVWRNFLGALRRRNDLELFPDIFKKVESFKKCLEIYSAAPLDNKAIEKIKNVFNFNGEIKTSVNKELIGGVAVKSENWLADASVKKKLKDIETLLIK